MNAARETRNARAVLRRFNEVRGHRYKGDEADLADLLLALMALAEHDPAKYGTFDSQLGRAQRNFAVETNR